MKISKQLLMPLSILILSSIGLASCGGGTKPSASLTGTNWQLSSINGRVLGNRLSKHVTLNFNSKRATGSAGCNRYFSGYKTSRQNTVQFDAIGATKRLCKPRFMRLERNFLSTLRSANSYQINNGMLSITGGVGTLKFRKP